MQYVVNGLSAGASCALVALGFGLIFYVCGFFHFAHGGVYALGAYVTYTVVEMFTCPVWAAVLYSILLAGVAGGIIHLVVYRPLLRSRAAPLTVLIASLGILLVIQNSLSLGFGDDPKSLATRNSTEGYIVLGARITPIQVITVLSAIAIFAGAGCLLRVSGFGKQMRAFGNDPELARIFGVDEKLVTLITVMLGSTLAGLSAILAGYDTGLTPTMGFKALLGAVVAVVVGGRGSVLGILLGGTLVGLSQNLLVWRLPGYWQDANVFLVLIVFLLLRPQGFFGKRLRKTTV